MPIQLQCTSVVVRNDALERVLETGAAGFADISRNSMSYADQNLSQASFMSWVDAEEFAKDLEIRGLSRSEPDPDFVIVTEFDQTVAPPCDWLILFEYEKRLVATLRGSSNRELVVPANEVEAKQDDIQHYTEEEIRENFEFVSREGEIDTYREKSTGQLVYHARHTRTPAEIFREAFDIIWDHHREPGQAATTDAEIQKKVQRAVEMLQSLAAKVDDSANVAFALGMGWFALGKEDHAIRWYQSAAKLNPENSAPLRELAGVYLTIGDTENALHISTQAVVLAPDDTQLLGNLAVNQLLVGQTEQAAKTIDRALQLDPDDTTNQHIHKLIADVASGNRPQPTSLQELMGG